MKKRKTIDLDRSNNTMLLGSQTFSLLHKETSSPMCNLGPQRL